MKPRISTKERQKRKKGNYKANGNMKRKEVDLRAMSVDDFMQNGLDAIDESEDNSKGGNVKNKKFAFQQVKNQDKCGSLLDGDSEENEDLEGSMNDETESIINTETGEIESDDLQDSGDSDIDENDEFDEDADDSVGGGGDDDRKSVGAESKGDEGDWTSAKFSHKKAVAKLQKTDPEFYKFLQENDKDLLKFDESDSDMEADEEAGGKIHKLPEELEGASDESDYEGVKTDSKAITLKKVKEWETRLQNTSPKSCETIVEVIHAFHAVVVRISNDNDDSAKYIVTGSAVFNAVIQLCVLELQPALKKYLRIPKGEHFDPTKCKVQWSRVNKTLKSYIGNLIKLLDGVSSTQILAVMLKHLHQMVPFAACFLVLYRPLMKKLVNLWSTSEDTVRVIAFLCLLRLTTHQKNKYLSNLLKMMYLAFIRNCKFVSPNTLPGINFMRRSLVEIFALDINVSYQHVFLYIRQLAIHLRNAITLRKIEYVQTVYNWQFINSMHLWADLFGVTVNKPQLQPLVYPLVQVVLGAIKVSPSAQYFPMRFHCTQILIELSKRTFTFIPVLPFLLEVLNTFDFNRHHKKVTMKPMTFSFIIRVSKQQMQENGFKDVIIDTIYQQMLEYLANESNSISFPDLIIPVAIQVKKFLKTCKVSNYCRKLKQMLDKILQNAQMVEKERQKVNFKLNDQKSIAAWETQIKLKGTPLSTYYDSWSKVHAQKQAKRITENDKIGDFNLPVLKKRTKEEKPKSDGPPVLFPSDDSDSDVNFLKSEDEDQEPVKKRGKRGSGRGMKSNKSGKLVLNNMRNSNELDIGDKGDIVEDLKLADFE